MKRLLFAAALMCSLAPPAAGSLVTQPADMAAPPVAGLQNTRQLDFFIKWRLSHCGEKKIECEALILGLEMPRQSVKDLCQKLTAQKNYADGLRCLKDLNERDRGTLLLFYEYMRKHQ